MAFEDLIYPYLDRYGRSPQWVKSGLGWVYKGMPRSWRLGRGYQAWNELASICDPADLAKEARARLSATLAIAIGTVPAYREYGELLSRESDPYAVLRAMPLVEKAEFKRDLRAYLVEGAPSWQRLETFTGGSTTSPMRFYLQRHVTRVREYAFMADFHRRLGMSDEDCVLSLRGRTVPTARKGGAIWMHEPIKNQLVLSSDHMQPAYMQAYLTALRRWRPAFIQAFPSALYPLAKWLALNPAQDITAAIRGVMLYSETAYPYQLELFRRVFGAPVLCHYGHSERCLMAATLPDDDRYHFWPQYGHLELVDEHGTAVTIPGATGEIVCTSFDNAVMPFVRYRTGDRGVLARDCCPSLEGFPVLDRIDGRLQEMVQCFDGRLISITTLGAAHFNELASVTAIQFEQHRRGELVLNVETSQPLTDHARRAIQRAVEEKTQGGCRVRIDEVRSVARSLMGKQLMLVQHIDVSNELGSTGLSIRNWSARLSESQEISNDIVQQSYAKFDWRSYQEIASKELVFMSRHYARRAFIAKRRAQSLIAGERDEDASLRTRQIPLLLATLATAVKYIPAYASLGALPVDESVFHFLRDQIPVIEKHDLISNRSRYYPNGGHRRQWWPSGKTSGTSGTPLEIFRSFNSAIWEEAFHIQAWNWAHLETGEPQAILRGDLVTLSGANSNRNTLWDPFGKQLFISPRSLSERTVVSIAESCRRKRCVVLRAYPSTADAFAKLLDACGERLQLKAVITGSEPLYLVQRERIESVFGCKVFDFYGMAERIAYAAECEFGHLHLNTDYSYVEILDPKGQPTDDIGSIVGTTLRNSVMPLLRYRISDNAKWVPGHCACGRTYPRIELSSGKVEDQLFDVDAMPISASVITFAFKGVSNIAKAQVAQVGREHWEVRVIPDRNFTEADGNQLIRNLKGFVSSSVNYTLRIQNEIHALPSGKYKWVSQEWSAR